MNIYVILTPISYFFASVLFVPVYSDHMVLGHGNGKLHINLTLLPPYNIDNNNWTGKIDNNFISECLFLVSVLGTEKRIFTDVQKKDSVPHIFWIYSGLKTRTYPVLTRTYSGLLKKTRTGTIRILPKAIVSNVVQGSGSEMG